MNKKAILIVLFCCSLSLFGQKNKKDILKNLDSKKETYSAIAQNIWEYAEMGYQEEKSVALLQ